MVIFQAWDEPDHLAAGYVGEGSYTGGTAAPDPEEDCHSAAFLLGRYRISVGGKVFLFLKQILFNLITGTGNSGDYGIMKAGK